MAFVSCVNCGRPLTEGQSAQGPSESRDRALCPDCLTKAQKMETMPLKIPALKGISEAEQDSTAHAKRTADQVKDVARYYPIADRRFGQRVDRPNTLNMLLLVGGGVGLAVLLVGLLLVLGLHYSSGPDGTRGSRAPVAPEQRAGRPSTEGVRQGSGPALQPSPAAGDQAGRWGRVRQEVQGLLGRGDFKAAWQALDAFEATLPKEASAGELAGLLAVERGVVQERLKRQLEEIEEAVRQGFFSQARRQLVALKEALPEPLWGPADLERRLKELEKSQAAQGSSPGSAVPAQAVHRFEGLCDEACLALFSGRLAEAAEVLRASKPLAVELQRQREWEGLTAVAEAVGREEARERSLLAALVDGRERLFRVSGKAPLRGEVLKVEGGLMTVRAKGGLGEEAGPEFTLAVSALAAEGYAQLVRAPEPRTPEEWAAHALRLAGRGALEPAWAALERLADQPLYALLAMRLPHLGAEPAEARARLAWQHQVQSRAVGPELTAQAQAELERGLAEFEAAHGKTRFAAAVRAGIETLRAGLAAAREAVQVDLGGGEKLALVRIPAGRFRLGSPLGSQRRAENEAPREVVLKNGFLLGRCEVTQAQYLQLLGSNPSHFKGPRLPVEQVSWLEAQTFCQKLSALLGRVVRLPTEAEWEYACRGLGGEGPAGAGRAADDFCSGDSDEAAAAFLWSRENSRGRTHPVGQRFPNRFGLFDMHGNVWEWCQSWYGPYAGAEGGPSPLLDYAGPGEGKYRVLRGGSYRSAPWLCRSAYRYAQQPSFRHASCGFRVAME